MSTGILGLGTSVPSFSVSQDETCLHAQKYCCKNEQQAKLLERLYQRTSIRSRASVVADTEDGKAIISDFFPTPDTTQSFGPSTAKRMLKYDEEASKLAIAASKLALKNANLDAAEVTHLITVSCTGCSAPGFDLQLVASLNLSNNVYRTHVGFMGCHGAMNALRVAQSFCLSYPNAIVLLCATEICSVHFQYGWTTNNLIANSLFADGAAAMVVGNRRSRLKYTKSISYLVPNSSDAITWRIGDNGFTMSLGVEVPDLIQAHLPLILDQWLKESNLAVEQIRAWAVHPGGPRVLDAVEKCLNLHPDSLNSSRKVLTDYGNMSSPTVLFILDELFQTQDLSPCLMLGFGPGLTVEAALFES